MTVTEIFTTPNNINIVEKMSTQEIKETFDNLYDEYVPMWGNCDNLGGECIRAMGYLQFRWYNDGDMINGDYSEDNCNPIAIYLSKVCPDSKVEVMLNEILEDGNYMSEFEYEAYLNELVKELLKYLLTYSCYFLCPITEDENMWLYKKN